MNSFDLQIYFVGLIGWVPRYEDGPGNEVGASAVLPRVERGHQDHGYETSDGKEMETHYPCLHVLAGQCSGDCPPKDPDCDKVWSKRERRLLAREQSSEQPLSGQSWNLTRKSVRFHLPDARDPNHPFCIHRAGLGDEDRWPAPQSDQSDDDSEKCKCPERAGFEFVPEMERICLGSSRLGDRLQGAQEIAPECLLEGPSTHSRVASLVELRFGRLETAHLVEIPKGKIQREVPAYEYRALTGGSSLPGFSRAMTDYVLLSANGIVDEKNQGLKIVFRGFEDTEQAQVARIQPVDLGDRPVVSLVVINRPEMKKLKKMKRWLFANKVRREAPAAHFEAFFELSRRTTRRHHRPVPWPHPDTGISADTLRSSPAFEIARKGKKGVKVLAGGFGRPICPQAQFRPVEVSGD